MIFIKGILYDNCYYYLNTSNVQAKSTFFIKLMIWVISFDSWRYKNQCNTHTCTHSYIHTHVCTHIYIQSYIFQPFLVPTDYTYICRFAWEHHMEQLLGDVKKKMTRAVLLLLYGKRVIFRKNGKDKSLFRNENKKSWKNFSVSYTNAIRTSADCKKLERQRGLTQRLLQRAGSENRELHVLGSL